MTENETTPKPEVKINEQETPAPEADATTPSTEQPADGEQTPATGSEAEVIPDSVSKEQPGTTETTETSSDEQSAPETGSDSQPAPKEPETPVVPEDNTQGENGSDTGSDAAPAEQSETPSVGPTVDIESLKSELDEVKSLLTDIKVQTKPVEPKPEPKKVTRLEDLSDQQRADLLVYGETFTDENGNRVAPDMVLKGPDGSVHYVEDDDY